MILLCHKIRVPLDQDQDPIKVIDLDDPNIVSFFNKIANNNQKRADCLIIYRNITALMEVKTSYPEKAILQLKETAEILFGYWNDFLRLINFNHNIPELSAFYLCMIEGLGKSRYGRDKNNNLIIKEDKRSNKHKIIMIDNKHNIPIKVYRKKEIDAMYSFYGVK